MLFLHYVDTPGHAFFHRLLLKPNQNKVLAEFKLRNNIIQTKFQKTGQSKHCIWGINVSFMDDYLAQL